MKKLSLVLPLLLLTAFNAAGQHKFDVVIYGGSAGGYAAAIQVARMGKSVALLEPTAHIGGHVVEGLGGTDVDNHKEFRNSPAVSGIALEFYKRVAKAYGRDEAFEKMLRDGEKKPNLWRLESSVAGKVIKAWLAEYKISLFYKTRLSESKNAVLKKDTKITRIKTETGSTFEAKIFIDATIEGDLLAAAGVSTTVGREANATYNETFNGIRATNTHAPFLVKVDPYKIPGDSTSGLIPTIQDEKLGIPGAGDNHLQAYCFRVCLTQKTGNKIAFYTPKNFKRADYEIYLRYLKAGGKLYTPGAELPNGKTDLGAWHDLSHNLYGLNVDYPEGNYATRKRILAEHETFTKGLFYFLANDPEVGRLDSTLQRKWSGWGYAKDEFTDNNGFPRMFYVRDARRMVSDYVITEHHVKRDNPTPVADPVTIAYWPTDLHSVRRIVRDGAAYNEGSVFGGDAHWRPLPISYRALVPKKSECTNLLTPTCPSSSHLAYGAIRIEWTFMALGQAVGTAAVMAIDNQSTVQEVDYEKLRSLLTKHGAITDIKVVGVPEE
ncbi:FAD-dependent oxidoreductase [Dyadobacter pollutisoli]|uniref:FAD-dependent oxidoreductase n=1 Tax=Dyadobacter pollutisoli TaxID=2910158 RepID=A0A9E8SRY4_9BACT|nr:FAD-dependent oxidoreductase [Dyadobacter pollutisoli]WAC14717.1 FAD-dependent oxidoreductase [Dyadobacter pollutisoli]